MRVIVMGVSGSGKSTVGRALADRLGIPFFDADDFHPPANIQKMSAGQALDDTDRGPWLTRLNGLIREHPDIVLACSALKRAYRDRLREIVLNKSSHEIARPQRGRGKGQSDAPAPALSAGYQMDEKADDAEATAAPVFVYLHAEQSAIAGRIKQREHFFPAALLDSQFDALEEPGRQPGDDAWVIDALLPTDQLVETIASRLKSSTGRVG